MRANCLPGFTPWWPSCPHVTDEETKRQGDLPKITLAVSIPGIRNEDIGCNVLFLLNQVQKFIV